jgi:hypothetical protein
MPVERRVPRTGPLVALAGGILLVGPLAVMEWWNTGQLARLPWPLFGVMAALATGAVWLMLPATQGQARLAPWARLTLAMVALACVAGLAADQMPCFMGAPNCD